jgi:hypothetical protein
VFTADRATVVTGQGATIEVGFQVPLMEGPPREYRLVIQGDAMRDAVSGDKVSTERRSDLNIPPAHGRSPL